MAAMIWDPALGAWQEAATPQAWDSSLQAYGDSTGLAWNPDKGAWEERWGIEKRLYLYKQGDKCTSVTGGWLNFAGPNASLSMSWGISAATVRNNGFGGSRNEYYAGIVTASPIDLTPYKYAGMSVVAAVKSGSGNYKSVAWLQTADGTGYGANISAGVVINDGCVGDIRADISEILGGQHIRLLCYCFGCMVTVSRIWLE